MEKDLSHLRYDSNRLHLLELLQGYWTIVHSQKLVHISRDLQELRHFDSVVKQARWRAVLAKVYTTFFIWDLYRTKRVRRICFCWARPGIRY